jgi:rubrerythrin
MKNLFILTLILSFVAFTSCNNVKPVKTIDNLKAGITGETTASAKYAAFAKKAMEEGNDTIAKLFEAASKAESIHAANHTKVLEELGEKMEPINPEFEVKTTAENLQAAIDGETHEFEAMYPGYITAAKEEKVEKAVKSFTWALDTEKKHADFYQKALAALQAGSETGLTAAFLVCPVCGNTYEAASVDNKCAFCMTEKEKFIVI